MEAASTPETSVNFYQTLYCPRRVFIGLIRLSEKTTIISLKNINQLILACFHRDKNQVFKYYLQELWVSSFCWFSSASFDHTLIRN